tara:strand:- start:22735 stop:23598 length:864 start_codon:yes stop_codon:yes gene_type:complete
MTASMTGFSLRDNLIEGGRLVIELKTLNSRYFELNLKIADQLKIYESRIREIISGKLARGKIECKIFFKEIDDHVNSNTINNKELKSIISSSENISDILKNPAPINPLDIYRLISNQPIAIKHKTVKKELFNLLDEVVEALLQDRRREGLKIRRVILKNIKLIESMVLKAKKIIPKAIKEHQKKIIKKFKEALIDIDDSRLKQEFLLFVQKSDITEEIDRLDSHIIELKRLININSPSGKKMDFLMQEFNREANTIGSKAVSTDISKISVELKVLIEQIREQIQNIE